MNHYIDRPPKFFRYDAIVEKKRIGKCSICGGDVVLPDTWMGNLPKGRCSKCGRREKNNLPTIEME